MSAFVIYCIVITGLYLIYMTVVITMDLFGKKGQKKDDLEVFNTSDEESPETQPTAVTETEDGYSLQPADGQPSEDGGIVINGDEEVDPDEDEEEEPVTDPDDDSDLEEEALESMTAYESLKDLSNNFDVVYPFFQEEHDNSTFSFLLAQPLNKESKILRQIVDQV